MQYCINRRFTWGELRLDLEAHAMRRWSIPSCISIKLTCTQWFVPGHAQMHLRKYASRPFGVAKWDAILIICGISNVDDV